MAAAGEHSLRRNSPGELKTMFEELFEKEYYSDTGKFFELQKSVGLHITQTAQLRSGEISQKVDLEEKILEDISNSNGPLSTLVFGDSGTGKSWLALNLTKKLYDSTQPEFQNKIPLYIPLGRIEKMITKQKAQPSNSFRSDILFSYIMNHRNYFPTKIQDGELQNLYLDICACELILVLDGYDELKVKSNLWEENNWRTKDFKSVRTIISCRPNVLVGIDVSNMFQIPEERECRYFILPLEENIVENYISKAPLFLHSIEYDSKVNDPWMMTKSITKDYSKWESAQEDSEYKYWFLYRLPELQGLAENVFILTTVCQLLPKLVEAERIASENGYVADEFIQKLQEICKTEVLLYDRFTETWFKYQVERMEETGHARLLYENRNILHHYMRGYAQNLAMRCARLNRGMPSNGEILEADTMFWNLWSPNSETFHRDESVEIQLFPRDENDEDEERQGNFQFLRDSCLLRYGSRSTTKRVFGFLHLSIFEYFLSREVFEKFRGALNYYSNWNRRREEAYILINQNNIDHRDFSGVLSKLVDRARTDENFQATLLEAIQRSATLPGIEQMASNAWTILNLSGYSFSGRNKEDDNFQNIQVPGANFKNSICGNSDFSGANFEKAKLNQGWFQGCKFQGVNFSECSLGQIPPISLGLQNFTVRDVLCCTIDGFEHVIVCCEERSPPAGNLQLKLYLKNYKFNANFELVESKLIFDLEITETKVYTFYLVELPPRIILFMFIPCDVHFLNKRIVVKRPDSWYEFRPNSLVNSGKFKETDLNLQGHLELFEGQNSKQKCISFSPNRRPEFCDKETLKLVSGKNKCWIKFIWIAFGEFKFLVSVYFGDDEDRGEHDSSNHVSLMHNGKPILCNDASVPLEIFWQVGHSDDNKVREEFFLHRISVQCLGSYFGDNIILSFPSTANTYFFDLKNNKVLTVLKNNVFNENIFENMAFSSSMDNIRRESTKFLSIGTGTNAARFVSKNLDFIALEHRESAEVCNVKTGRLAQNVLKDIETHISFICRNGSTYLVYVLKRSLHFEKLEAIDAIKKSKRAKPSIVAKYFSGDGSVCIVSPFIIFAIFDIWNIHNEAGLPGWKEIFDRRIQYTSKPTSDHSVLITPSRFVVFKFRLNRPLVSEGAQLNGYDAQCRQKIDIEGIPIARMSPKTKIFMFQEFQKIVFRINKEYDRNNNEYHCYSVTENVNGETRGLGLVHDVTFINNFKCPELVFDPNGKRSYIFSKNIVNINPIGVWNLENNAYRILQVKDKKTYPPDSILCTILLKNKIIQGYSEEDWFCIFRSNEYSKFHAETPINVSSSSKLGWIAAQFQNGDLVILESRKLDTMFVFFAYQPGFKFHITLKSPEEVRIALIIDYFGEVVWLCVNAVSLRQCYEQGKLEEFKDWKVNKSELPSSSLSLREVDISSSRSMDKQFLPLFKSHGSLGSPSEGDAYKKFYNLFVPVTEYKQSILITSDNKHPINLTNEWHVTVIAKKSKFKLCWTSTLARQHAALIIEGILYGGHFVVRAELTRPDNVPKIKCESYRGKSEYVKIIEKYNGKQLQVNSEMGMKLLKNIWVDTYNPQWQYNLLHHNCNSWCKEKLKVLNLETKFKAKAYKLFADLPKDFELGEFQFST